MPNTIAELRRQLDESQQRERAQAEQNTKLIALVERLQATLATQTKAFDDQRAAMEKLTLQLQRGKRRAFGKSSEKMPSVEKEIADQTEGPPKRGKEKRKARTAQRDSAAGKTETLVPVTEEKRCCPHCLNRTLKSVGHGRASRIIEYVAPQFVYEDYVLETLACPCGDYIVTAEPPDRVFDKSPYGPRLIAHVIVAKLLDSIPHYRLAKSLERQGVPLSRQTMTDLLHRAAELLAPLVTRLFALIAAAEIVQADETSQRRQDSPKRGFVWTFLTEHQRTPLIAYKFAADRSGQTPADVLGDSNGYLLVDMYSGYNVVTTPKRRRRAGCWAHVRRRFWEIKDAHPETKEMLDAILDLYRVEYEAKKRGVVGTKEHLALRHERSWPVLCRIHLWLRHHLRLHPPKSPLGQAMRYVWGNFRALRTFMRHPQIRLDNNRSEGALRTIALGRKNYLFVGHEEAGENIAVLMSLLATCEANGVNAEAYLADVLLRVARHPARDIDALLPHRWQPATA